MVWFVVARGSNTALHYPHCSYTHGSGKSSSADVGSDVDGVPVKTNIAGYCKTTSLEVPKYMADRIRSSLPKTPHSSSYAIFAIRLLRRHCSYHDRAEGYQILHYSRVMPLVGGHRYLPSTAVFLCEVLKLTTCSTLALYELSRTVSPSTPATSLVRGLADAVFTGDSWKLAIPARWAVCWQKDSGILRLIFNTVCTCCKTPFSTLQSVTSIRRSSRSLISSKYYPQRCSASSSSDVPYLFGNGSL